MFSKGHLLVVITFLSVINLSGCGNGIAFEKNLTLDSQRYLKEHQTIFKPPLADNINFSAVADHFEGAKLVLLGETHASALNEVLDIQLFKYLYFNHGVRHYLAENGYGAGILINEYIQTGDINLLHSIFQLFDGTFSNTKENYDRIVSLRAFNASLPSNAKITYIGIDIEQQPGLGLLAIRSFILDNLEQYPAAIRQILGALKSTKAGNYTAAVNFGHFFLEEIQRPQLESLYQNVFNGHYDEVILILKNIILRYQLFQDDTDYLSKRENQIAANFDFVSQKFPNGKFYGKWGVFHTWKHNVSNQESSFLKKAISAGYIKDKETVSIPIFYENSFYADKNKRYQSTPITSMLAPALIRSNSTASFTIFDLNETSSPFAKRLLLVEGAKGVTTDYFDVMIKISGSKASQKRD